MFCGNGGSAADSQHLATEMLIRLRPNSERAVDRGAGADAGSGDADRVRQRLRVRPRVRASVARAGPARATCCSGSRRPGRSANVVRALEAAREMGIVTVGLLGGDGRAGARRTATMALLVPDTETARIQECHIALGHAVLELLEDRLIAAAAAVTVLVTGAAGFIGYHVAEALLARGETRGRGGQPERLLRRAAEAGAAGPAAGAGRVSRSTGSMFRTGRRSAALVGGARRHRRDRASGGAGRACGIRWSTPMPMCRRT